MNLLVLGWLNHENLGDDSYQESFRILFPDHNLTFVDRLTEKAIEECEVIILGGGNILKDAFIRELQKVKGRKKIYGFSIGVEEIPEHDISFFEHIFARDQLSIDILKKLNIPCTLVPDAAFILEGNPEKGQKIIRERFASEKCDLYNNVVTVVVNSYMLNGSLSGLARDAFSFIKFSYDFARLLDETSASFLFVPFGTQMPHDDRTTNAWVASKCKYWKKNHVIFDRLHHQEALDLIAASNMVISSRLHSSIFSFISGTPFLDITHHSKNAMFLNLIGHQNDSVSFWQFDSDEAKEKINKLIMLPKHTDYFKFKNTLREYANAICFS